MITLSSLSPVQKPMRGVENDNCAKQHNVNVLSYAAESESFMLKAGWLWLAKPSFRVVVLGQ